RMHRQTPRRRIGPRRPPAANAASQPSPPCTTRATAASSGAGAKNNSRFLRSDCRRIVSLKRDTYFGVGSPYRVTMRPDTINDDVKTRGNADRRGYLHKGSGIRDIFDRALKLGSPLA